MRSFDFGKIQCTGITANQEATGERHFRQRIKTAFRDGPGAIGDPFSAAEVFPDLGMCFISL